MKNHTLAYPSTILPFDTPFCNAAGHTTSPFYQMMVPAHMTLPQVKRIREMLPFST
jgi:hypothetical protein